MAFSKPSGGSSSGSDSPYQSMAPSMSMSMSLPEFLPDLLPWETKYEGYSKDIMTTDNIPLDLICGICKLLLRTPYQNFCGHRYCMNCVIFVLEGKNNTMCPVCASEEEDEQMDTDYMALSRQTLHPDNAVRRMLMKQQVKCVSSGCNWTGKFGEYDPQHYVTCEFHVIVCKKCGIKYKVNETSAHEESCQGREVECEHCGAMVPGNEIARHKEQFCGKVPVDCPAPGCGAKGILKENLEHHYRMECKMYMIPCPYGCIFTFVQPNRIDEHEHEATIAHVRQIHEKVHNIQCTDDNTASESKSVSQIIPDLLQRAERLDVDIDRIRARGSVERDSDIDNVSDRGIVINRKVTTVNEKVDTYPERLGMIESCIEVTCVKTSKSEDAHRVSNHEMKNRVKQSERQSSIQDLAVKELQQRITILEECCSDSVLMWKVPNFQNKLQEAKASRTMSIYSPPFYTSKYGYKMCLRLYPNGDGMGKGSHVSLFFVVMKGEYDALLPWPFRQKVNFTLINQLNGSSPIKDQFRPDPSSTSFQRPRGDMNVASGCPYFCPQNQLTEAAGFLKDDTIFIKADVERPTNNQIG